MLHKPEPEVLHWIILLCIVVPCSVRSEALPHASPSGIVKEPSTYRNGDYNSAVPLTVKGAKVIESAQELQSFLHENPDAALLDVFPAPRKPDKFGPGELWLEPKRQTLPGAVWLANTGVGKLPEEIETLFKTHLKRLTSNNKRRSVVIFCEPGCWHSWNAAKRAASYGYSNIYWYRQGVSGWVEADFPVQEKQPERP